MSGLHHLSSSTSSVTAVAGKAYAFMATAWRKDSGRASFAV